MRTSHSVPLGQNLLAGGGELGALIRAHDWARTPLGPLSDWPASLKTAVEMILGSRYPMFIWWGPHLSVLYNDAYIPVMGRKHPGGLGKPAPEVWADVWSVVGPMADAVLRDGRATLAEELLLVMERHDYREETYFTFSYSPVLDDLGSVGGIFCACWEDTATTLGRRRLRTLRELATRTGEPQTVDEACRSTLAALAENPHDLPFALLYLVDHQAEAVCKGVAGVDVGDDLCPERVPLVGHGVHDPWDFGATLESGSVRLVHDVFERFGPVGNSPWPDPPRSAAVLPIPRRGQEGVAGFLVAGLSPWRRYDDDYARFLSLVAGGAATAIASAQAFEEERRRSEALAQLDRAKTVFFSNVSHEFRTPLTLLMAPLEDELSEAEAPLPPPRLERLEGAYRNSLRLLKLVNTLLDFSRIEAGRSEAVYEPTDLSVMTTDLAGVFRSAVEGAGMRLRVDCPDLDEPVYVDRDMWEKIVLNLVSNAFKYTLEGEIEVSLRRQGDHACLRVRDTGIGISHQDLPRVFDRFHRVPGAQGRSHEGTGIGLALVLELAKLHGGQVSVDSVPGKGSTFRVDIPLGTAHLPPDRISAPRDRASTATGARPYLEEALRWLPGSSVLPLTEAPLGLQSQAPVDVGANGEGGEEIRPRVLVADDNADMRDYLVRLLRGRYEVLAVTDCESALEAVRGHRPDLVLTDIMMPRLDGLGLVKTLRAQPEFRQLPVILLSARAGEESRLEGLAAGANDYIVKPFSARELLAHVESQARIAQVRRQAERSLQEWKNRYEAAVSASGQVLYDWDPQTNGLIWAGSVKETLGYDLEELDGGIDRWTELIHPDDRDRFRSTLEELIATGDAALLQYRVRRKNGSYIHVEDRGSFFLDADGRIARMVGFVFDITDRVETEEALRQLTESLEERVARRSADLARSQEALQQAERLSAIGRTVSVVGHEARNNIQNTLAAAELLARRAGDRPDLLDLIAMVRNSQQELQRFLDELREYAGPLVPERRMHNLRRIWTEAWDELARVRQGRQAGLYDDTCEPDAGLDIRVDGMRLRQVFRNIFENALAACPDPVEIRIRCLDRARNGRRYLTLAVADNGPGIEADSQEKLFEPFYTTKAKGTGLGLSIVRRIVEAHDGHVCLESHPGGGLTVVLGLPDSDP